MSNNVIRLIRVEFSHLFHLYPITSLFLIYCIGFSIRKIQSYRSLGAFREHFSYIIFSLNIQNFSIFAVGFF